VVQHLPSNHQALSSKPSTGRGKKETPPKLRAKAYLIVKVEPAQIPRFCCSSVTVCKRPLAKQRISDQGTVTPFNKRQVTDHLLHASIELKNLPSSQVF
jgi:hypothetical protein